MNQNTATEIATLAPLVESEIVSLVTLYKQLQANHANVKPLADVLAGADANYEQVIATAKAEIAANTPTVTK